MKHYRINNIVIGLALLLVAVLIVLSQLNLLPDGVFPEVSIWQIILGVILLVALIKGIFKINFGVILFSLALLGIIFSKQLHIEALTPWALLLVAVIGTIALNLIFKNKKTHHKKYEAPNYESVVEENIDGDGQYLIETVRFSGASKYIHSENLKEIQINCSFCGADFYFTNVKIPSRAATININASFCGIELYIPKNWHIIDELHSSFGASDFNDAPDTVSEATVTITGDISFGAIEINRI